jgi:hypothetical protein
LRTRSRPRTAPGLGSVRHFTYVSENRGFVGSRFTSHRQLLKLLILSANGSWATGQALFLKPECSPAIPDQLRRKPSSGSGVSVPLNKRRRLWINQLICGGIQRHVKVETPCSRPRKPPETRGKMPETRQPEAALRRRSKRHSGRRRCSFSTMASMVPRYENLHFSPRRAGTSASITRLTLVKHHHPLRPQTRRPKHSDGHERRTLRGLVLET